MKTYANGNNLDSNNYYLNNYLDSFTESEADLHTVTVGADIYWYTSADAEDDTCEYIYLEGDCELTEYFEEEDFERLSLEEQLEVVGFDKSFYPDFYEFADIQWHFGVQKGDLCTANYSTA